MALSIPVDSSWTLTFDDEFNGTLLDATKWTPNWVNGPPDKINPPVQPQFGLGAYDPQQVSVHDGFLDLSAVKDPVTASDGNHYDYRVGLVTSRSKFDQTYGYFEARINLSGQGGKIANWPSFWTIGSQGENDIMEGIGGSPRFNYHTTSGSTGQGVAAGDFTGWHLFAARWQAGSVDYYYDDVLVGRITAGITGEHQFMMLVNMIGNFAHTPRMAPAHMQVDWVHVYSQDPVAIAAIPQTGYTGPGDTLPRSLNGTPGIDRLWGGFGDDQLAGLAGKDVLTGSGGHDILTGGKGADRFDFNSVFDSGRGGASDVIKDFSHKQHDLIDLSTIDANTKAPGAQAFDYIRGQHFHHVAGELRFAGGILSGDVNGDGRAEFAIKLAGLAHLVAADLVL